MSTTERSKKRGPFDRRGRGNARIFGVEVQSLIKGFFGSNAAFAIIILLCICFFLVREAALFFPTYQHELEIYRKSGQEFVTIIEDEKDEHQRIRSLAYQAYGYEIYERTKEQELILENLTYLKNQGTAHAKGPIKLYERAAEKADSIAAEIDPDIKKEAEKEMAVQKDRMEKLLTGFFDDFERSDIENPNLARISKENFAKVKQAALNDILGKPRGEDGFIAGVTESRDQAKARAEEALAGFYEGVTIIARAREELEALIEKLRPHALKTKQNAVAYETAVARQEALARGAENATTDERRERLEIESQRILTTEPNYDERNEIMYASLDDHTLAAEKMLEEVRAGVEMLDPSVLESQQARDRLKLLKEKAASLDQVVEDTTNELREWNHEKDYSMAKVFFGFFFGKKWVTNSTWQDFYGLAPLFTGSLIIALIAVCVSVPFAVGAAIYVNQLASPFNRTAIKPVIEFIEAIPSIVLGLFGILVLGDLLQQINNIGWLADILPGFPIDSRLNMLNAGLLLAFMSVPTIFTLAEDALNNVPKAHTEASLALGASKMQTVVKVVFPAAISGILAAVLLGFGRVIGETMVVLLVAGNRIAVPDFAEGLGVITQPAHTMTGIIAQEMGEVSEATLHWRALFMVGLVLFIIALMLNFIAQKVITHMSKHN